MKRGSMLCCYGRPIRKGGGGGIGIICESLHQLTLSRQNAVQMGVFQTKQRSQNGETSLYALRKTLHRDQQNQRKKERKTLSQIASNQLTQHGRHSIYFITFLLFCVLIFNELAVMNTLKVPIRCHYRVLQKWNFFLKRFSHQTKSPDRVYTSFYNPVQLSSSTYCPRAHFETESSSATSQRASDVEHSRLSLLPWFHRSR